MAGILEVLQSVQDAFNSLAAPSMLSPELVLPELKLIKLNDSVYELCKPSGSPVNRPSVEIVFFHSLQFDGSKNTFLTTWLSKDGEKSWLPWIFECFPEARILLISYNQGCKDMFITSENLVHDLIENTAQVGQDGCPVVLVGHGLGGLVIKEVLLKAQLMHSLKPLNENLLFFLVNVKHLFYYSCPNTGTRLAKIKPELLGEPLFDHLNILNEQVARCNDQFWKLRRNYTWKAYSIGENLPTDLGKLGSLVVVEEASARHDTDDFYTAHADHINVCRPESTTDASFCKLVYVINCELKADVMGHKLTVSDDEVVGLDETVKTIRQELEKSRQVGLFGPGGIGKSTLAAVVYNDMSNNFEYTCFVSEVKITVTEKASLEDLQAEILKNLYYKGRKVNVQWSRLKGKRVLIILDDVQYESQVLVLTKSNGFSTESCVLLTSRDRSILRSKDFEVHVVDFLNDKASKTLFCKHAFRNASAREGYEDLVDRFTKKCGGWPLILEVAGKYLYKQERGRVWDDAFAKLSQAKALDGKIDKDRFWPIFKVIYYSLEPEEQQMFLDIAVCFHDEELESVKRTWRVCRGLADAGCRNLLDMGLVTITSESPNFNTTLGIYEEKKIITKIQMHEVLRDLGRSIACPDPRNVQGHSHVCYNINSSLWPFEQGIPEVKILKIVGEDYVKGDQRCTIDTRKLRGLENLKALWLHGVSLRGACSLFPAKLEFLKVEACDWSDEPVLSRFRLPIIFRKAEGWYSRLRATSSRPHPTLRHLEIERRRDLEPMTNTLEQLKGLEHLSFEVCSSRDLPHTFKQHGALKHLRMGQYLDTDFPTSLADLQALEHLEVGLSRLEHFPGCLARCLGQFRALQSLAIGGWKGTIPESLGQLSALENLTLKDCPQIRALPSTLGRLKALRRLEFLSCGLTDLPETLEELDGLQYLKLSGCHHLKNLTYALGKLQALGHLEITRCSPLNSLIPTLFMKLLALRHFEIQWEDKLEPLRDILAKCQPLQLQHLTVWSIYEPSIVMKIIGSLDAVKHLNVWIGKNELDRVGEENRLGSQYFEILPHPDRVIVHRHLRSLARKIAQARWTQRFVNRTRMDAFSQRSNFIENHRLLSCFVGRKRPTWFNQVPRNVESCMETHWKLEIETAVSAITRCSDNH